MNWSSWQLFPFLSSPLLSTLIFSSLFSSLLSPFFFYSRNNWIENQWNDDGGVYRSEHFWSMSIRIKTDDQRQHGFEFFSFLLLSKLLLLLLWNFNIFFIFLLFFVIFKHFFTVVIISQWIDTVNDSSDKKKFPHAVRHSLMKIFDHKFEYSSANRLIN